MTSIYQVPPRTDRTISTSPSSVAESPLHNPFIHPQPPLHPSQRSESSATSSPISAHNPFVHRNVPTRSDSGNTKLPPLPPRKPLVAPIPPPMIASPSKHINRSRSPSKPISSATNPPPPPLLPHPPTIPPKPSHHITSTLIKQSLQATKAAQTMKKAEEQLDRERVMQVLKSSSTVSGAYPLAGASVTNSSVVVGTHVYNQHQYRSSSPTGQQGGGGGLNNRKLAYAESSISSSSDERAPPLPKRRTQQQQRPPSPPLSASSFEQVALASTHHHHSTSAPPSSTNTAFSNPETSDNAHTLGGGQQPQPRKTSSFHSRPRFPLDSNLAIPYTSSPERSPSRTSLDFQNGTTTTTRGRPPPTHPDRKPHHLQQQQQQQDYPKPKSHSRSQSYPYPDPFAGSSSGFKQPQEQHPPTNVNESFEKIYGPSTINTNNPPTPSTPPTTIDVTPSTPSPNRAFRSKSLHQLTPPVPPVPRPLGRKRPESVQVSRMSDIGGEVDQNEANKGVSSSRHVAMTANGNNNRDGIIRRSSLSVSTTMPSSSSSPSQFRQTQTPFGIPSSSSTTANLSGPPPPPSSSSASSSSTTTMKQQDPTHPNPLASLQKTFLQFQPHLDKARYKAEAGLSKRGFVRREGFRRNKSSGSAGGCVDGDGEEEEDGFMEDGLEGLMNSNGNGNGNHDGGGVKKQIGKSRWRDVSAGANAGAGVDGEVDQDSDWTRSKGMSMSRKGRVQDSDGDDEEESSLEKDNLKWPVGEGWKPL